MVDSLDYIIALHGFFTAAGALVDRAIEDLREANHTYWCLDVWHMLNMAFVVLGWVQQGVIDHTPHRRYTEPPSRQILMRRGVKLLSKALPAMPGLFICHIRRLVALVPVTIDTQVIMGGALCELTGLATLVGVTDDALTHRVTWALTQELGPKRIFYENARGYSDKLEASDSLRIWMCNQPRLTDWFHRYTGLVDQESHYYWPNYHEGTIIDDSPDGERDEDEQLPHGYDSMETHHG